jgi:hypothetical protein
VANSGDFFELQIIHSFCEHKESQSTVPAIANSDDFESALYSEAPIVNPRCSSPDGRFKDDHKAHIQI